MLTIYTKLVLYLVKNKKVTGMSNPKKRFLIIFVVLLAGAGSVFAYSRGVNRTNSDPHPPEETVNYTPPDSEEKQAGDKQKETNVADEEKQAEKPQDTTPALSPKKVSVVITDASQYGSIIEVRSFVSDYYQDGTCTLTFSKGGITFSKQTPAYKDISTTICTNPTINRSEFSSAGDWQVTVSYLSKNKDAQGSKTQVISIK